MIYLVEIENLKEDLFNVELENKRLQDENKVLQQLESQLDKTIKDAKEEILLLDDAVSELGKKSGKAKGSNDIDKVYTFDSTFGHVQGDSHNAGHYATENVKPEKHVIDFFNDNWDELK